MGAYNGYSAGASKFYAPLVMRQRTGASGLTNTQIMIQNTGSDPLTGVTITFIGSGTYTTWTKTAPTIAGAATFYYDVADETNLPAGWYGSAVIDAGTGSIAVVINVFFGPNGLQTYNAFTDASKGPSWAIPLFASRLPSNKLSTPVSVQNLSGGTIPIGGVTLTCKGSDPSYADFTATSPSAIDNNGGYTFNPVTDSTLPSNFLGACTVSAGTANVVVFVQMRKPGFSDETAAYEAFNTTTSTDTQVIVPLAAKRLPNGFATALAFQNLSNTASVVKLTYTRSANCTVGLASYVFDNITVAGKALLQDNLRLGGTRPTIPDGWFGTATLTHDSAHDANPAVPFVGFVQLTNIVAQPGDTYMAHDAFTLP
jgi:hypothetical protein